MRFIHCTVFGSLVNGVPGWFFFLLFLLLILAGIGWVVYTQVRARRQGLEPPSWRSYVPFLKTPSTNYPTPRHAGPFEWIKDQFAKLRMGRTARGAYEETGSGTDTRYAGAGAGAGRRARGIEDDAWDTRVGNEDPYGPGPGGYYEEQELGLTPTPGLPNEPYGGGGDYVSAGAGVRGAYAAPPPDESRGRSKSREPPPAVAPTAAGTNLDPNPFGDQHEAASLRSVSPRPEVDTAGPARGHTRGNSSLDAPQGSNTSPVSVSKKSMFREGL